MGKNKIYGLIFLVINLIVFGIIFGTIMYLIMLFIKECGHILITKKKNIIDVYECEHCNKEFDNEKKAIKHEKSCLKKK
jgi:hypothetical protein